MPKLKISTIYADPEFNCRDAIAPIDVIDLAKDIQRNGLTYPIIVEPFNDPVFDYRIVAGHRRFMAHKINKATEIECIIKEGLTELQARSLNLKENLLRAQLNIMQEARALEPFFDAKWTEDMVAAEFCQSRGWVQVRRLCLDFPPDIQMEIAAGVLTQAQIRDLHELSPGKWHEAVKELKERKEKGEKKIKINSEEEPKQKDYLAKEQPTKTEIEEFIETIARAVGMGFYTRCLAWAAGNISTVDIYRDLKDYADTQGFEFDIPPEIKKAMS